MRGKLSLVVGMIREEFHGEAERRYISRVVGQRVRFQRTVVVANAGRRQCYSIKRELNVSP